MTTAIDQTLEQVYGLIEADKLAEARALLEPLLDEYQDHTDLWWLYAHAVEDPDKAQRALANVMRLDPEYPGAAQLAQTLRSQHKTPMPPAPQSIPGLDKDAGDDIDDFDDDDFDFDMFEDAREKPRRSRRLLRVLLLLLLVIVLVLGAAIVLSTLGRPAAEVAAEPSPTADDSIIVPTDELFPTPEDEQVLTPEPEEPEATAEAASVDAFTGLYAVLADFDVPSGGIVLSQTSLGETVVVSVCSEPGLEAGAMLKDVMDALAEQLGILPPEAEALAVSIADCDQDGTPRLVGVPVADAAAYADGEIDDRDFQRLWQPLD